MKQRTDEDETILYVIADMVLLGANPNKLSEETFKFKVFESLLIFSLFSLFEKTSIRRVMEMAQFRVRPIFRLKYISQFGNHYTDIQIAYCHISLDLLIFHI